jgi:hypothetical protein
MGKAEISAVSSGIQSEVQGVLSIFAVDTAELTCYSLPAEINYLGRLGNFELEKTVEILIDLGKNSGVFEPVSLANFANKLVESVGDLVNFVDELTEVLLYGDAPIRVVRATDGNIYLELRNTPKCNLADELGKPPIYPAKEG